MAKKKKPAGNPARGFATTSVASKSKPEKAIDAEPKTSEKEDAAIPHPGSQLSDATAPPPQTQQDLTPEEFEAQLERDELQLLVEKHAAKVRRESRRQLTKFQTDRRVLRSQSHSMTVGDWVPDKVMDEIIRLAQAESNDSNRRQGQDSLLKILSEEDAMSRLWTLDLILRDLGFSQDHIQPVLKWLCANAVNVDATNSPWGFQEALEWLALDQCEGHAFSYEDNKPKQLVTNSPSPSRPVTPISTDATAEGGNLKGSDSEASHVAKPNASHTNSSAPVASEDDDNTVSDLDSDLEPDQLIPTYLKVKSRLFDIEPSLVDSKLQRQGKKSRVRDARGPNANHSHSVRKLLSQLQQLGSDALFDEYEAETQWVVARDQISETKAAERRLGGEGRTRQREKSIEDSFTANAEVHDSASDVPGTGSDGDESGMLGEMFLAIPDQPVAEKTADETSDSHNIQLRDFGKQSGLSPRKLLEETVRARDPKARISYKLISPTTYSCRHSLIIAWSKDQDIVYDDDIAGVTCMSNTALAKFEASTLATVAVEQSESFISTAALFSILASSTKEDKIYLRLPSNWRDLYRSFLEHRKNRIDAEDRDMIKSFRALIQDQVDMEESDGVVLTNRFKLRSQAAPSTNGSTPCRSPFTQVLDSLKALWAQKSSTTAYRRMLSLRMTLPVFGFRESILSTVDKYQVTIICGETGCGKSTQIPSFILDHELSQGKPCKVFCTEPRRISAISLAQRVSEELGEAPNELGTFRSLVGYSIRLEAKTSQQTRLIYATVGVVLRMLESSGGLEDVTHLIIDEVHERSIDTDFLLIILRTLLPRRPLLKVVLMSATVDAQRFSKYLNDAPILTVPGRTFPVQSKYLEDAIEFTNYTSSSGEKRHDSDTSDNEDETSNKKSGIPSQLPGYSPSTRKVLSNYDEYAIDYQLIVRLMEGVAFNPDLARFSNAFLVFLPGIAEIRQLNDMLLGHPSFDKSWLVYPLHSTISSEDQQAAFLIPPQGVRKIVLATNIAETGVTIPDITCVIDTGKHKEMRFDERRQLSRLTQSFISRANAKQRRGRAGRVQEGLCFHLFTKHRHDTLMADQQTPEMLRLSLQDLVMRTKICNLGDIEKTLSEALDPPSSRNIRRAIDALIEVDAMTPSEELTPLGRQIAKLPLDAQLSKLVLVACVAGCVDAAVTIAAILSSKSPFLTPFGARQRADVARFAFKKGESDLLTTYNAYKAWKRVCTSHGGSEYQFCNQNFLSPQNLAYVEDLKAQFLTSLVEAGFVQVSPDEHRALSRNRNATRYRMFVTVPQRYDVHSENDILVNSIIATAFYPRIMIREGKGWRNISNNQTVSLAPTSVNKASAINPSTAKFLSYYHIMQTTNKFYNAHSTSVVHPLPMVLMAAAEMDFKLHAGVISFPGNVLRFAVKDWRAAVALKVLRRRVKEILAATWKNPSRQLSGREKEWLGLFFRIFEEKAEREERLKERGVAKTRSGAFA